MVARTNFGQNFDPVGIADPRAKEFLNLIFGVTPSELAVMFDAFCILGLNGK
jgi:hypothetical protein